MPDPIQAFGRLSADFEALDAEAKKQFSNCQGNCTRPGDTMPTWHVQAPRLIQTPLKRAMVKAAKLLPSIPELASFLPNWSPGCGGSDEGDWLEALFDLKIGQCFKSGICVGIDDVAPASAELAREIVRHSKRTKIALPRMAAPLASLAERFRKTRDDRDNAYREFCRRLRERGIRPELIFCIDHRAGWESEQSAMEATYAGTTTIFTDTDPDYLQMRAAELAYESVTHEVEVIRPRLWPQYQAWEKEFQNLSADGGLSAAQVGVYQVEYAKWIDILCAPPAPVPSGWEGEPPEREIRILADLDEYLEAAKKLESESA